MTKEEALLLIKNKNCTHVVCSFCTGFNYLDWYGCEGMVEIRECRRQCAMITREILIDRLIKGERLTRKLTVKERVTKEELWRLNKDTPND